MSRLLLKGKHRKKIPFKRALIILKKLKCKSKNRGATVKMCRISLRNNKLRELIILGSEVICQKEIFLCSRYNQINIKVYHYYNNKK